LSSTGKSVSTTRSPAARRGAHLGQAVIGLRADHEVDAGARRRISSPSAWATQPATPIFSLGPRGGAFLQLAQRPSSE
jgi:hypothetical protein